MMAESVAHQAQATDEEAEEDCPYSPNTIAEILNHLFRRESDTQPFDFYVRFDRFLGRPDYHELVKKFDQLKLDIQKCGGNLSREPSGSHSVELAFREVIEDPEQVDSDIFDAAFVHECIKWREVADLEEFRIGKSPYQDLDVNEILTGNRSWESVRRRKSSPQGRKLPDFAANLNLSPVVRPKTATSKGSRSEFSTEEDVAIIRYLIKHNLFNNLGGNSVWMQVERAFPSRTYHSLSNRFRKTILPNLHRYKAITEHERRLFTHEADPVRDKENRCQRISSSESDEEFQRSPVRPVVKKAKPLAAETPTADQNDRNDTQDSDMPESPVIINDSMEDDVEKNKSDTENGRAWKSKSDAENGKDDPKTSEEDDFQTPNESETEAPGLFSSPSAPKLRPIEEKEEALGSDFTIVDDTLILEFIAGSQRYAEVGGTSLWKDIIKILPPSRNGVEKKTWETARSRFKEVIFNHLDDSYKMDAGEIRVFRKRCRWNPSPPPSSKKEAEKSPRIQHVESSDSDNGSIPLGASYSPSGSGTETRSEIGSAAGSSGPERKKRRISENSGPKSRTYSVREDKIIIDYIVERKKYEDVKGTALWKDIEASVLKSRSWQSAKNRFLKTILIQIDSYGQPKEIIKKFREGATAKRNLGGAAAHEGRRRCVSERKTSYSEKKASYSDRKRVEENPEEEIVIKHPAHLPAKKSDTPMKVAKRQLYSLPIVPTRMSASPQTPGPSTRKPSINMKKPSTETITEEPPKASSSPKKPANTTARENDTEPQASSSSPNKNRTARKEVDGNNISPKKSGVTALDDDSIEDVAPKASSSPKKRAVREVAIIEGAPKASCSSPKKRTARKEEPTDTEETVAKSRSSSPKKPSVNEVNNSPKKRTARMEIENRAPKVNNYNNSSPKKLRKRVNVEEKAPKLNPTASEIKFMLRPCVVRLERLKATQLAQYGLL